MSAMHYPSNSFRYKLLFSFLNVFIGKFDYLLVKDVCYGNYENCQNFDAVDFIQKSSKLYSHLFYSSISEEFSLELKDFSYVFENEAFDVDIIQQIYYGEKISDTLSDILLNRSSHSYAELLLYYFLIIKIIKERRSVYIWLPIETAYILNDFANCRNEFSALINGMLDKLIADGLSASTTISKIEDVYRKELSAYRNIVNRIVLFGSIVRNEVTNDSDIDMIIYVNACDRELLKQLTDKIKLTNINYFDRKSDIHIAKGNKNSLVFEGDYYEFCL